MAAPLDHFLGTAGDLQALSAHAARLSRLDRLLQAELPDHLVGSCRVANLRDGQLIVHVEGGAAAAKLRQLTPRLVQGLQRQAAPVSSLRLRVKPPDAPAYPPSVPTRALSAQARTQIDGLAAGLPPDSPVAAALRRLAARSA